MGTSSPWIGRALAFLFLSHLTILASPVSAATDGGSYLLRLESGDSIRVFRVEPATFGMFRYVGVDSAKGYLPAHRIRSITDHSGRDLTRDVLDGRRAIGVDRRTYRSDGRRHRPPNRDRVAYPILDVGVYVPLHEDDDDLMMGVDFGVMRNLSRNISVGGAVHLESDGDRDGIGLALRGRRWLSNSLSVDGAAGWIFGGDDERGSFKPYAYYGEAALNWGDHFQLAARIESWRWEQFGYSGYQYQLETRRETLIQFGGKEGPIPGIPIFIAFLLLAGDSSLGIP